MIGEVTRVRRSYGATVIEVVIQDGDWLGSDDLLGAVVTLRETEHPRAPPYNGPRPELWERLLGE